MMHRLIVGLLAACVALAGWAGAQDPGTEEPPIRLKKKDRATEDRPKEDIPKEDAAKPVPKPTTPAKPRDDGEERLRPREGDNRPVEEEPEMDEQEVLNRVTKNMRLSEDRIANRELTDSTQQVQDDIVKDLDRLIDQMQNGGGENNQDQQQQQNQQQQQQQQQGGQQSRSRSRSGQQQAGKSSSSRRQSQRQQASRNRGGQGQQQQQQEQQQANRGQQQQQPGTGNQPGLGGRTEGEMNKLSEIYKEVWGHLPETLRAEMNAYSREQFMAKYNDLIRQYYTTIAEKGRRKE